MRPAPAPTEPIEEAVQRLRAGGLVAAPTETVYGLGADALNPLALRQVFALKGRPVDHPLIAHLAWQADLQELLAPWAALDPRAIELGEAFWPGPLTLVLPRAPGLPDELTGGLPTVGLRVPDHPVAQELLRAFGSALAAPSANRFGRISPTLPEHVREELGEQVLILEGGPCRVGIESTIVDLSGGRPAILRPGSITAAQIEARVGPLAPSSTTRAPGTLAGHYAPRTALRLSADPQAEAARLAALGLRVAVLAPLDPESYASALYAELRRLDAEGVDLLVAGLAPEEGLGLAVNDRLRRAAFGSSGGSQI